MLGLVVLFNVVGVDLSWVRSLTVGMIVPMVMRMAVFLLSLKSVVLGCVFIMESADQVLERVSVLV